VIDIADELFESPSAADCSEARCSASGPVAWQLFSLRIGTQISAQVMLMLPHERHGLTQRSGLGLLIFSISRLAEIFTLLSTLPTL